MQDKHVPSHPKIPLMVKSNLPEMALLLEYFKSISTLNKKRARLCLSVLLTQRNEKCTINMDSNVAKQYFFIFLFSGKKNAFSATNPYLGYHYRG